MKPVKYRIYADNTVIHEDYFDEWDNSQPFYDDYCVEVDMPYGLADVAVNLDIEEEVVLYFNKCRRDGYAVQIANNFTMKRFELDKL